MMDSPGGRRRASIHITRQRASRLYRLVRLLESGPQSRADILGGMSIGLRTFYRELDLLKKCGLKVQHKSKLYTITPSDGQSGGRLPFPDPQLSFAEMAELARCDCEAGRRLASLLAAVTAPASRAPARKGGGRKG